MINLTRKEAFDTYKDVEVVFTDYYKYVFNYRAINQDGTILLVSTGGDPQVIYRMMADPKPVKVSDLWIFVKDLLLVRDHAVVEQYIAD